MIIVVMGPAGAGKSTVGAALARSLGWRFVDADDFHPHENLVKLAHGEPLTDRDRAGWLLALHNAIARAAERRESMVLACSALTDAHRATLVSDVGGVRFAYLKNSAAVLRTRLAARQGHVAKATLLESQLAMLEEPVDATLTFDGEADIDTIVARIRNEFGA